MNTISDSLILYIISYLDLTSILSLSQTSKPFLSLIRTSKLWTHRKPTQNSQILQRGALFQFDLSLWQSSLYTEENFDLNYDSYKQLVNKIHLARPVLKSSLESSTNNPLSGMLKYEDDLFWNSKPKPNSDNVEVFICELVSQSLVFTFNFKVYRALCQGGMLYPPSSIKIHIGNDPETFHYSSVEYKVPLSDKLCTLQILPQVVIGRFLKVELIGMVTPDIRSGNFMTAIEFLEVVGYPIEDNPIGNLEKSILDKNSKVFCDILGRNKSKATPFIIDLICRKKMIYEYLSLINRELNEAESFVYVKSLLDSNTFPKDQSFLSICKMSESLGDLLFESGKFIAAYTVYLKILDIWKLTKTAIVLKNTKSLEHILSIRDPRYPRYSDLKKISASLGPEFLEYIRNDLGIS